MSLICALGIWIGQGEVVYSQEVNSVVVDQMLDQFETGVIDDTVIENTELVGNREINSQEDFALSLEGKKIFLEADQMSLMEAINKIALQVQVPVQGQELLVGNVTAYFSDIDFLDALRLILNQFDLSYVVEEDLNITGQVLIKIMTAKDFESQNGYQFDQNIASQLVFLKYLKLSDVKDKLMSLKSSFGKMFFNDAFNMIAMIDQPERVRMLEEFLNNRDVALVTKVFSFRYVQGVNVISSIESMLTKGVGQVKLEENSNGVVVTDTENKIKDIEKFIKDLDQQNKQVVVSAKVIQITLNQEHQDGIDWEAILSDYKTIPFEGLETLESAQIKKILSLGNVNQEDLKVLLDALDTVGVPNIISDSKLTVDFNEDFDLGIDSKDLSLMSEAKKQNAQNEEKRSIKFDLYTFLSKDDVLTLKIMPNLVVENKLIPGINDFKVDIKNGETVVIGGLFKNVTVESTRRVPLLGDLPFLGFVFRNQGEQKVKTETILFLTLQIINK